jgi:hypothetical protein
MTPEEQAALAYGNAVPLPAIALNADPNGFMSTGEALSAVDPAADPAAQQPPVGQALDAVNGQEDEPFDALAAQLANGGRVRITSQEQFDAMSPHQKAVIRAAVSSGGRLRASDALRIYQDSIKQERATQVRTVTTSDGRQVDMVNGQILPQPGQPDPVKYERWQSEDGTMMLTDPTTGKTFPAWDAQTGAPMRGPSKLSATQEDNIKRLQLQSENVGARLTDLTRFTESDSVQYNDETGTYEAAGMFGGTKVKNLRKQLETEKSDFDKRLDVALRPVNRSNTPADPPAPPQSATPEPRPSVTPTPTPRPNPMPTPDQFQPGKRYRDANGNVKTYLGNGAWE